MEEHADRESVWFVYEGKVYDGTKFLNDHPGGPESILIVGGQVRILLKHGMWWICSIMSGMHAKGIAAMRILSVCMQISLQHVFRADLQVKARQQSY